MFTLAAPPPSALQRYLIRVDDSNVIFTPIKRAPEIKNFFLLETKECYKFSVKEQRFVPAHANAILYVKHGEVTQKLFGFKSPNHEKLMDKIAKWVINYVKLH